MDKFNTPEFNINIQINERLNYLKNQQNKVQEILKKYPEGKLRIMPGSTEKSFRYYFLNPEETKDIMYLDKTKKKEKMVLAYKRYYSDLIKNITKEIEQLEKIKKMAVEDSIIKTYTTSHPGIKKLISPMNLDDQTYAAIWMDEKYSGKRFAAEDKTSFYSDKGERMRSKSELLIANRFALWDIPYKYEYPIELPSGVILHPDFTILDVKKRKIKYWEHLGRLEDNEYMSGFFWKLEEYRKIGIYLGKELFVTGETAKVPLTTDEIKKTIELILDISV